MEAEVGPLQLALDPYQCGPTATRQHWRGQTRASASFDGSGRGARPQDTPLGPTLSEALWRTWPPPATSATLAADTNDFQGKLAEPGSANFSTSGENAQDNDLIVIHDADAATKFEPHFARMCSEAQPMIEFEPAIRALEPQ